MAKKTKKNAIIASLLEDLMEDPQDVEYRELFGKKWGFRQLTSQEHLEALRNTQMLNKDETARTFGLTVEYLRSALVSLEGYVLTDEQKEELLANISPTMVQLLYFEFESIRRERIAELGDFGEETPEETEEVKEETTEDVEEIEETEAEDDEEEVVEEAPKQVVKKKRKNVIDA